MNTMTRIANPSIDPLTNLVEENAIHKLESYYYLCIDAKDFATTFRVSEDDVVAAYGPSIGVINSSKTLAGVVE